MINYNHFVFAIVSVVQLDATFFSAFDSSDAFTLKLKL